MAEDPFEKARKEMERAQREFHERVERAQEELHAAMGAAQERIAEARAEFQERMERFRAALRQAGCRPPPRPKKPPRGRFGGSGRPWNPDDRGGPQPTPVRPINPSLLSGGAEAPLD